MTTLRDELSVMMIQIYNHDQEFLNDLLPDCKDHDSIDRVSFCSQWVRVDLIDYDKEESTRYVDFDKFDKWLEQLK